MAEVPVNDEVPSIVVDVVTNGQVNFDYDFRADLVGDLKAEYRPASGAAVTGLVGGVDFTATGLGTAAGGTITLTTFTATVAGDKLAIYRDIPIERENDYSRDLFADDLNAEQDRVFMILQELARNIGRALKLPIGSDPVNVTKGTAGQILVFDTDGNLVPQDSSENGVSGNMFKAVYDPLNKLANAFDSAFHDFKNAGAAVIRSVRDRLRATIWLEDYGAVGDGVTDDTAAVTEAVAQSVSLGKSIKGNGQYLTSTSIPLFHDAHWRANGSILRKELGPEIVTNGDFSSSAGWLFGGTAPPPSISGGKLVFANANGYAYRDYPALTPGKTYRVSFKVENFVTGAARISLSVGSNPYNVRTGLATENGEYSFDLVPTAGTTRLLVAANPGTTLNIDDVSIREVITREWHLTPPNSSVENLLYAAAAGGSAANDGLSSEQPFDTGQHAVDALEKWAPLKKGNWGVSLSAGVHASIRLPDEGLPSSFPVIIEGPDVAIEPGRNVKFSIQNLVGAFVVGETITFSTSGATATVTFFDAVRNVLFADLVSGTPVVGQTMTGGTSGATASMDYQSPTPLAKIKEGATQSGNGILAFHSQLRVKNIEIEDFNGSTSSNGVRVDYKNLFLENVHFIDCYHGASLLNFGKLDVKGGFSYDCGFLNSVTGGGFAYRGVFHVKFEIGTQNGPTTAGGPAIKGCSGAVRAQELSTGHLDWTIVNDNDAGIRLLVNSRLNVDGSVFLRNTASAMYGTQGSHVDVTDNTIFGTGTNANGRNWSAGSGSTASGAFIDTINVGNGANPGVIKNTFPGLVINSTGNTLIDTFTVKRGALNDTQFTGIAAKKLTARITGTLNGTTGAFKRLILRVGGSLAGGTPTLISFATSATGAFEAELSVFFKGPNSQRVVARGHHPTSAPVGGNNTTISTSADMVISLEGVMADAADNITVESVEWIQTGF